MGIHSLSQLWKTLGEYLAFHPFSLSLIRTHHVESKTTPKKSQFSTEDCMYVQSGLNRPGTGLSSPGKSTARGVCIFQVLGRVNISGH